MNIYFSNKTTVRSENNMSDLDIMQANNELGREKKKLRYTVTIAIAIPVFIIIYFFLIPRLFHNVGMRIVIAAISMVIGYFPAEAPKYSVIVSLNKQGYPASGGSMAGAVFRKIAEWLAQNEDCVLNKSK